MKKVANPLTSPTRKSPSEPITFRAILLESKHDREGVWTIRMEVSKGEAQKVVDLSEHVEKTLDVTVNPPNKEVTFGRTCEG